MLLGVEHGLHGAKGIAVVLGKLSVAGQGSINGQGSGSSRGQGSGKGQGFKEGQWSTCGQGLDVVQGSAAELKPYSIVGIVLVNLKNVKSIVIVNM